MTSSHLAAVLPAPKTPLEVRTVKTHHPGPTQVLIRTHAIAIQPLDTKVLIAHYGPAAKLPFPAVLGGSAAGVVEVVGANVTNLQVGDRVVFDTKAYVDADANAAQGTWQQLVISSADTVAKIGTTPFEQAALLNFPLQTAVAALHVFLGMGAPGTGRADEKVLIWGAGGAVGQYAVQYAASVGHTVVCTASARSTASLLALGASAVVDYKDADAVAQLRALGPFTYAMTASGDAASQQAVAELLQPGGGRFASVLPLGAEVTLPAGVEIVYAGFSQAAQKEEHAAWRDLWYNSYLPSVLSSGSISPVSYTHIGGGLAALQSASQDVFDGKVRGKLVINPQE